MKKTLSASDIRTLDECELAYKNRSKGRRKAPENLFEIVGDTVHAAVAAKPEERAQVIAQFLEKLPEEERAEAQEIVEELVVTADELEEESDATELKKENQLSWFDPISGWTLKAKPDDTGMTTNDYGREIPMVLDKKTAIHPKFKSRRAALRLLEKYKKQVFFFGLVYSMEKGYYGPIKLVVRFLGDPEDRVPNDMRFEGTDTELWFWYSPKGTERSLNEVRSIIKRIETARAKNEFRANTGFHCYTCPYRETCQAFQAWDANRSDMDRPPAARRGQVVATILPVVQPKTA